ncbi:MAG TPA: BON domain-containing protein [Planctomycetota bacterium]|nr:BON domain-containing protein [Planctomycetota bacterium]
MQRITTVAAALAILIAAGCGDQASSPSTTTSTPPTAAAEGKAPDNTAVNKRDQNDGALTPINQAENSADIATTAGIRKAVVGDDALSQTAKNVKIITNGGKVTLRGPVKSTDEKTKIKATAEKIAGAGNVDDQLEVAR